MAVIDIENMTVAERLQAIEALWESLPGHHEQQIETPKWHQDVLKDRMAKIKSGKAIFMSIDELAACKNPEN
jgi:putative addiction module component (TIGR02574 family)